MWSQAAPALEHCLQQVPGSQISVSMEPTLDRKITPDLASSFIHAENNRTLFAEAERAGEPLYAFRAFSRLEQYRQTTPGAIGVFIAPYISPETTTLRLTACTFLTSFEGAFSSVCRSLGVPCAFTAFAAAARYAPYATYQCTTAYVRGDLANLQALFDLAPVEAGANVVLFAPDDDGVFYDAQQRQDVSLASPVQTYLDLQSASGSWTLSSGSTVTTPSSGTNATDPPNWTCVNNLLVSQMRP